MPVVSFYGPPAGGTEDVGSALSVAMRWVAALGIVGLAVVGNAPARAETPIQLFQRMVEPTLDELRGGPIRRPAPKRAAETPLLAVPMPHLKPADAAPGASLGFLPDPAGETIVVPTEDMPMPMPRIRPAIDLTLAVVPAATASLPTMLPPRGEPLVPLSELTEPPPAAQSTCGVSLAMLGVTAVALEEIEEGQCGMSAPVEVAALDGGAVDIAGQAIVNCAMAEAFAGFMEETVEPLAARMLNGTLTGVRVAAGYACRNRNNLADTKLSEHGKGNAIDIAAFEIDGRWVTVGATTGDDDAFVSAVRESACGPFKTVLGPGSDAYHADHLHLDLAQRRNGGTYCR